MISSYFFMSKINISCPGPWFNIKMSSCQYRNSHCGDKTVVRSSYLRNGISYTGKMSSLYWIRTQVSFYNRSGLILGLLPANERHHYKIMPSLNCWVPPNCPCSFITQEGFTDVFTLFLRVYFSIPGSNLALMRIVNHTLFGKLYN